MSSKNGLFESNFLEKKGWQKKKAPAKLPGARPGKQRKTGMKNIKSVVLLIGTIISSHLLVTYYDELVFYLCLGGRIQNHLKHYAWGEHFFASRNTSL